MKDRKDSVKLAWEEAGTGLPVLLLHAYPLSSDVGHAAQRPGGQVPCNYPDFRGFGGSQATPAWSCSPTMCTPCSQS